MKNKLKTKKAAAKRIKVVGSSKNKKFMQRTCTQDHFNARDRGKDTTAKRLDKTITSTLKGHVKRLLPYS
ncbi:MAG: 50S ribosomal protein L35 [Parcubacteria group bacterium]|nr:50S ribosomal protein L35 [Parcubacteria group bacterium]